jgi:hypothetical protein
VRSAVSLEHLVADGCAGGAAIPEHASDAEDGPKKASAQLGPKKPPDRFGLDAA